ncbi:lipolytic protein G-D-S-L family [Solidesulfovibrio fructosivorans JJ]]|uniref:Lipolytic protein G-D-S-L family n=1 Tax=Solidesulfovibrio fructosivorans JJ] TaxID=596151 RepID=E1JZ49_SOLFR|nr:SGNH/GDSL hydrolase family protein [Solidesulfovibrio fructosivorans]EFL50332.1 lipolytic protein G-D-S-L family [Solidesulfovibrio fructosivorans JJ]]
MNDSAPRGARRLIFLAGFLVFCLCLGVHLAISLYWAFTGSRPAVRVEPRGYANVLGDMEPRLRVTAREIDGLPYTVTTNNQGFRGEEPVSAEKTADGLRVLCLGDSFTYGVGVDDDATYPALLETLLRRRLPDRDVQVINAGVPFYDIFDELSYFREKGAKLKPDVVVVQFFINDLEAMGGTFFREDLLARQGGRYNPLERATGREAVDRRLNQWLEKRFPRLTRFVKSGLPPSGPSRAETGPLAGYHVRPTDAEHALLGNRQRLLTADPGVARSRLWSNYRRALLALRDAVVSTGARFLFVLAPDAAQVREDFNQPALALVPFCRENGIPVIDLARQLRAMSGEAVDRYYLLPRNGHLSAEGNTVMATAVAEAIHVRRSVRGPVVSIAPARRAFDYADPVRLNLKFGPRCVAPAQNGPVRIRAVRCDNLVPWTVDIRHGRNRISGLRPDVTRGPLGTLTLRVESEKPMAQVSVTFFRKFAPPVNGYAQLSWSRGGSDYTTLQFASEKDVAAPESFETSRLAEIDLREKPARVVFLKLELRNEARIFKESLDPPWRRFEVVCYPADSSSETVSRAATDRRASPADRAPGPD